MQAKTFNRALIGAGALALAGASQAAAVDVTGVVSEISAQIPSVVAIGAAVLMVVVAVKAFQWVRRALS